MYILDGRNLLEESFPFIILLLLFFLYMIVLVKQPILLDKFFLEQAKNRLFNREGGISKTHPLQSNKQGCESYFAQTIIFDFCLLKRVIYSSGFYKTYRATRFQRQANNPDLGGSQPLSGSET